MSLSSLNSIEQTVFELKSGNENVDGQTDGQMDKKRTNGQTKGWRDKKWTNKQMELHQFRKEPSYDGDLCPVKCEFDRTNRF